MLSKQIEEELNGATSPMDPIIAPTNVTLCNELLSTASLKKKEVETKTAKRKKAWYEKKRKCAKKGVKNKKNNTKVCDKKKGSDNTTLQNACPNHPYLPQEEISESYTVVNSFSQLLKVMLQIHAFFL
jgi:hypothetical protein